MSTDQSTYAVLHIHDFRMLALSRLLITVAFQLQTMAVGWQIYTLTKDPLALGFAGLAEALPSIAVSLYAGHLADISDRKTIAVWTIVAVIVSMFGLAAASTYVHQPAPLTAILYVCVAITGVARGFYNPAVFGLVSQIVPRELYANASAWNSAIWQGSAIAGPILGGSLYVMLGAPITYAGAGALLLFALMTLVLVRSKTDLSEIDPSGNVMESIKEGLKFVFSHQVVLGAMTVDLFGVLFGGAVALLPIFSSEVFHRGPEALGILRAAPSIGALLSATIMTRWPVRAHAGLILLSVVAGFGLCMIGFGLSTNFELTIALLAVSGVFDGISVYLRSTIYQLATPDNMKGRVAAVNSIFIGSSNEIGEFESGIAAKVMGTVRSVIFGGCMTLLVVAITAAKAPKLRNLDVSTLEKERDPSLV